MYYFYKFTNTFFPDLDKDQYIQDEDPEVQYAGGQEDKSAGLIDYNQGQIGEDFVDGGPLIAEGSTQTSFDSFISLGTPTQPTQLVPHSKDDISRGKLLQLSLSLFIFSCTQLLFFDIFK